MENIQKKFKNKKILITGHTGFKGAWLSQILLNWGACITGISLKPTTSPNLFNPLKIKNKINNYFTDIRDFKKIKEIVKKEKPEIVFHLAAQPIVRESYDRPLYTFETNIIGTANILEAIKETNTVRSAVIITTDKVYKNNESGRPFKEGDKLGGDDPYSASKAAAEIVIDSYIKSFFNPTDYNKKHKTLIASARAGNVIGGGDWSDDRLVPDLIKGIFHNKQIIIRNPDAVRPWQHVLEPLYGYLLLATKLQTGKKDFSGAWNFGPNNQSFLTVEEFTKLALRILNKGVYVIKKDLDSKHESKLLKLNSNKAKKQLNWQQELNINKTLQLTFEWYKNFYNKEDIIDVTNRQIESFFTK
ncbi:CDP-glucose 4,6-dehydratase [Patescibacteria group bacterium]|nr:CDP-glucose 4,6-dehydratase [Candidatus Falkowbacteria bacterium]MBU3906144.1 CDP-glucose 4,6-dehydratase [Patescibacteria group bacterium]MBU4014671.1 CDP-glucose 4,6-dehydratase [Patescibacteria group bacterium]MBU4026637.1 CDP-glucose 4,6-dehydratase [Patescibacteria group bacterium]MBU4073536.1 CDP-glucose 4,6-dehydratase [Patescibacteria group bacterium]